MPPHDSYSLMNYGEMLRDQLRTAPLVEALRQAITPGAVVLDIGTSVGFFAFLACELGAARVYAMEPNHSIDVARQCAADNPGAERIVWMKGVSTELQLPESADVVIADLHGVLPFFKSNIPSMIDARRRHLRSGGTMIPGRDILHAVPAFAPDEYEMIGSPWVREYCGVDLTAAKTFLVNQWWRAGQEPVTPENFLAPPRRWAELDYSTLESVNVDGVLRWAIERAGTIHGYYVWFDCETAPGHVCSNAPNLPTTVYGRAFFPVECPVELKLGDVLILRLSANLVGDSYVYRWDTKISDANGQLRAAFRQSSFNSRPVCKADLDSASIGKSSQFGTTGKIALHVLDAMAHSATIEEIVKSLMSQFPGHLSSASAAFRRVRQIQEGIAGSD